MNRKIVLLGLATAALLSGAAAFAADSANAQGSGQQAQTTAKKTAGAAAKVRQTTRLAPPKKSAAQTRIAPPKKSPLDVDGENKSGSEMGGGMRGGMGGIRR